MSHPNRSDTPSDGAAGEFLTFVLGEEEYGVDILRVQEIRSYDAVTRLPDAPDYIKGVINLRGIIVPVVDMRLKFRLAKAEYNALTVMIVLNVGSRVVGVVVDSVSDVVQLSGEQIRAVPEIGATIDRQFLTGIGTLDERMLILLDIERLMGHETMGLVAAEAACAACTAPRPRAAGLLPSRKYRSRCATTCPSPSASSRWRAMNRSSRGPTCEASSSMSIPNSCASAASPKPSSSASRTT